MNPVLELSKVVKSFPETEGGNELTILSEIDLCVESGGRVAVVGPSGSGKSTLLNLIGALDTPTSGEIRANGREIHRLTHLEAARFRNQTIGMVFQAHHLLPSLNALENVMVPGLAGHRTQSAKAMEQRGRELLEAVGMGARLLHLPGQLSGGERQRVAVARALFNQPELLLADEPTGSLDEDSARQIVDLLLRLNRTMGVALIVVTHSMACAERMDEVFQLRHGRLARLMQ